MKLKQAMYDCGFTVNSLAERLGSSYNRLALCLSGKTPFYQFECDVIIYLLNKKQGVPIYEYKNIFHGEPFSNLTLTQLPAGNFKSILHRYQEDKAD